MTLAHALWALVVAVCVTVWAIGMLWIAEDSAG